MVGMLPLRCLVVSCFALPSALTAAETLVPTEAPAPATAWSVRCAAILAEAEAVGLPSLAGARLYRGLLLRPGEEEDRRRQVGGTACLHAALPDGRWLVDLVDPVPAAQLDAADLAALVPFTPGMAPPPRERGERYATQPHLVALARRVAVGDTTVGTFPPEDVWYRLRRLAFYPRDWRASNPDVALRLALVERFLGAGQGAAALAVAPPTWQAAVRRHLARQAATGPFPEGDRGLVAAYRSPIRPEIPGVDRPLLTEVGDAALVALAGDLGPAAEGGTIGETALLLLGQRWGIDPAVLAGRDPAAPWDDAEQAAVAAGLAAWWQRTEGQDLIGRWTTVLVGLPPEVAMATLRVRDSLLGSRQSTIEDRLRCRTWRGPTAPEPLVNDRQVVRERWCALVLERFRGQSVPPENLTQAGLAALLVDRDQQAWDQIVSTWPRTGPLGLLLREWDDARERPAGLDAWVEEALAAAGADEAALRQALTWWVYRGNPARRERLWRLLDLPMTDPRWRAVVHLAAGGEDDRRRPVHFGWSPLHGLLCWRLLQDQRPWPGGLMPNGEPAPADATVADVVALSIAPQYEFNEHIYGQTPAELGLLSRVSATSDHQARQASVAALRRILGAYEAKQLTWSNQPLPAGMTPPAPEPSRIVTTAAPSLTTTEAAGVTAALDEARQAGFPDLTGARFLAEGFPGTNWWGVHILLQDGTWLAEGVWPARGAVPGPTAPWLLPASQDEQPAAADRLPVAALQRLGGTVRLGRIQNSYGDTLLAALSWWRSGQDPEGRLVVAAAFHEAALQRDLGTPWSIAASRGGDERGVLTAVPDVVREVRRDLARWFRMRLTLTEDVPTAERLMGTIRNLLDPRDRPAWEPLLAALRARVDLPTTAPSGADLATRLMAWMSTPKDAEGRWFRAGRVPAQRSDTAALVALLTDDRPTRWVVAGGLPRTVGDAALEALGDLWHLDWRWLVVDDPAVAAVLPPRRTDAVPVGWQDHGDEWLWSQTAWTPARRAVIMPALQAWWQVHGGPGAMPLVEVFRSLPTAHWSESLRSLPAAEASHPRLGDVLAERLRTLEPPQPGESPLIEAVQAIAIRQSRHAGVRAVLEGWPRRPWLTGIFAIRDDLDGQPAAFDGWMAQGLAAPPPAECPYSEVMPWTSLGLWIQRPTAARLTTVLGILARADEDPGRAVALVSTGRRTWGYGWWGLAPEGGERARAVPVLLAWEALGDVRPLTRDQVQRQRGWVVTKHRADLHARLPVDARACDVVALNLLDEDSVIDPRPRDLGDPATFLAAARADRDRTIAVLRQRLQSQVEESREILGLTPVAPSPATKF